MSAAHADYNPDIQNVTKDEHMLMMRGLEHRWLARTATKSCIHAIEVWEHNLILATIKATWVK